MKWIFKKKHLSKIIIGRTFLVIMGTFLALMAVTVMLVYIHAERRAKNFVRFSLEDIDYYITKRMDESLRYSVSDDSFWIGTYIAKDIKEGRPLQDAVDQLRIDATGDLNAEVSLDTEGILVSEFDLVDPKGIIIASTAPECIGFDLHTDEQMAEFLCLFDGSTDIYSKDMIPGPAGDTLMTYYGMLIPDYGGLLLEGTDTEDYHEKKEVMLIDDMNELRIGRTGYYLYLNKDLKILSGPEFFHTDEVFHLPHDIRKLAESGEVMKDDVYGVPSYVGVMADDQEYIVSIYPVAEAFRTWNILILILLIIYVVTFTMLFLLVNRLLSMKVLRGVYSINRTLGMISRGKLDEKADFRESLEFDGLSDGVNHTVDRLKELIKEAEGRIDAELEVAAKIQISFLPCEFPPFPDRNEFDLYACMIPAKEVGGDFYDFFFVDDDHLALVIADVSEKGIPAAMFMVMAKDKIRHSVLKYGTDVAEAVREVNTELCKENDAGLFVTVWLGVFTVASGHMDYVDAGHEYPAIYRAGGEFRVEKDIHCVPVSAEERAGFKAGSFDLKAGDILYLYIDGVTEAINESDELFSM